MNRPNKFFNQRGDTIVEVLVVLAVLGMAISIAYATANKSLLAARQAQESSQASVLLQAQVEKLRVLASTTPSLFNPGPSYCINEAVDGHYMQSSNCSFDSQGVPDCTTTEPCYDVTINYTNSGLAHDTFTLVAKWDDIGGQGHDTVTTVYRTHQDAL